MGRGVRLRVGGAAQGQRQPAQRRGPVRLRTGELHGRTRRLHQLIPLTQAKPHHGVLRAERRGAMLGRGRASYGFPLPKKYALTFHESDVVPKKSGGAETWWTGNPYFVWTSLGRSRRSHCDSSCLVCCQNRSCRTGVAGTRRVNSAEWSSASIFFSCSSSLGLVTVW